MELAIDHINWGVERGVFGANHAGVLRNLVIEGLGKNFFKTIEDNITLPEILIHRAFVTHRLTNRAECKQYIRKLWKWPLPSLATLISFSNDLFSNPNARHFLLWLRAYLLDYLNHLQLRLLPKSDQEDPRKLSSSNQPPLPPQSQ